MSHMLSVPAAILCLALAGCLVMQGLRARQRVGDHARLARILRHGPDAALRRGPAVPWLPGVLERLLLRAGCVPTRRQVAAAGLLWLAASAAAAMAAGLGAGATTACALAGAGWMALACRANRRARRLSDAMLGFLERVRQLLAVGNSLAVALARAAESSPPVVADSLAPMLRRIANGEGVADGLAHCAQALDLYELHLLQAAARANLRFGGPMADILKTMIETIRARAAVERELRAGTAQIRASAWVLGLLPVLVAAMVTLTNRDYSRWFLVTATGHAMIAYALGSQLLGVLCMRLIVRTRF